MSCLVPNVEKCFSQLGHEIASFPRVKVGEKISHLVNNKYFFIVFHKYQ